jgi:hypothetical protein
MTQIILTGVAGFLVLAGFSLFFVWLDERAKKKARQTLNKRFQKFDKYYSELQSESERNLEKKRKERMEVLGYANEESNKQAENIDITRFSGNTAV